MGEPVRLNLGCGNKLWPGFINVDKVGGNWSGIKPDVECDVTSLPFGSDYADEIHAIHIIEHFHRLKVDKILSHWRDVLKPGGLLVLECPSLDKIAFHLQNRVYTEDWLRMTLIGLYGEYWREDSSEMMHKWCYSAGELKLILKKCGFRDITVDHPKFHRVQRDMRLEARK